jgi:pyruvate dehydrogenase E2 component (dihydrolipoamide acetyltransferase)
MPEFRMPALGADMEAATLTEWLVKPGDVVERGQVVAVVETDKGAIEVEIWEGGTVECLVVAPGVKVPVGELLAVLRASEPAAAPVRLKISPAARRLAEERGIDPASVPPSGSDGVITREDVERAAAARAPAGTAAPVETARPAKHEAGEWQAQMRRAIAAAMSRSKREIPHYYLATDIDVGALLDWLSAENLRRGVAERVLPVVPMMKAVALALREVPELNGFWRDGAFVAAPAVHLGMAIAMRGGGLVAPAIHDAASRSLDELMGDLRDLITRVRGGRLRSSELVDATATLTSLGEQGVEQVFGVIYPPQVALVGLGKVVERPRVVNGVVEARRVLTATLAADHRASDGHRGGLFLAALARLLQDPEALR